MDKRSINKYFNILCNDLEKEEMEKESQGGGNSNFWMTDIVL